MPTSLLYSALGQSHALAISGGGVNGPVTVTGSPNPDSCYVLNPSSTSVAIAFTKVDAAVPQNFRFPNPGAASNVPCHILPPLMQTPIQVRVPSGGFRAWGIGVSPVSVTVYIVPSDLQS